MIIYSSITVLECFFQICSTETYSCMEFCSLNQLIMFSSLQLFFLLADRKKQNKKTPHSTSARLQLFVLCFNKFQQRCSTPHWCSRTPRAVCALGCLNIRRTTKYWSESRGRPRWWKASRKGLLSRGWTHLVCSAWRRPRGAIMSYLQYFSNFKPLNL